MVISRCRQNSAFVDWGGSLRRVFLSWSGHLSNSLGLRNRCTLRRMRNRLTLLNRTRDLLNWVCHQRRLIALSWRLQLVNTRVGLNRSNDGSRLFLRRFGRFDDANADLLATELAFVKLFWLNRFRRLSLIGGGTWCQ